MSKNRPDHDKTLRSVVGMLNRLTQPELDIVIREAANLRTNAATERESKPVGTLVQQWVICGKDSCQKCADGLRHGPYWYRRWRDEDGRYRGQYLGRKLPIEIGSSSDGGAVDEDAE